MEEVPTPEPGPGEVRVRVRAAGVNAADWRVATATPFLVRLMLGFWRPRHPILGSDLAGTVDAVGPGATRFKVGDEVYGILSHHRFGAFAEWACGPEAAFEPKPLGVGFEAAAAVPMAAGTALQALRAVGRLQPGEPVLIHGASGGVGLFAVQLARLLGGQVTAVCGPRAADRVRELGAGRVIDYTREDFATEGPRYALIVAIGGARSIFDDRRSLLPGGRYVMAGGGADSCSRRWCWGPCCRGSGAAGSSRSTSSPTRRTPPGCGSGSPRGSWWRWSTGCSPWSGRPRRSSTSGTGTRSERW